jgi:succinyl-diaminopimelate desuccinylase
MINKKRLIRLTRELIRIDSQNPLADESRIARFVRNYLNDIGLPSRIIEFKKGRSNLLATLKGRPGHSLLLTPHLDTVPAGNNWSVPPFSAKVSGGKLYGLGSTDCKGNLACAIEVLNSLIEERCRLKYDVVFAATADEESGSGAGLIPLLKKRLVRPDAALILDSDDFDIVVAQKGLLHVKVTIKGKKAHGAYPWRGINAIDIAVGILAELKRHRAASVKNKYLRPPTVNIGTIRGGDKVNVVADWCAFELDFRFLPGQSADALLARLKNVIVKHARKFSRHGNSWKIEVEGVQKPYVINEGHPLIRSLTGAMKECGVKGSIQGSEGATVITFFQTYRIPAIATGFGSEGCAHTADEYVRTENLYRGAQVLEAFLKRYDFRKR